MPRACAPASMQSAFTSASMPHNKAGRVHETLKNLSTNKMSMMLVLIIVAKKSTMEALGDGIVSRVALQLHVTTSAQTQTESKYVRGQREGPRQLERGQSKCFRRATYRLELEEDGQKRRRGTSRHTYQQMRWVMFMILPHCACQCISVTRTHTVVGQWRGRVRRATVDEWTRAISEQPHSQHARTKRKVRSPRERATVSRECPPTRTCVGCGVRFEVLTI